MNAPLTITSRIRSAPSAEAPSRARDRMPRATVWAGVWWLLLSLWCAGFGAFRAAAADTNFGFTAVFYHSAAYQDSGPRTEQAEEVIVNAPGIPEFAYGKVFSAGDMLGLGAVRSELCITNQPGHLGLYWKGEAGAGSGDLSHASLDLRARFDAHLNWDDTLTIENDLLPPGAELEVEVSYGLVMNLSAERPSQEGATFFAQTRFITPTNDWTIAVQAGYPLYLLATNDYQRRVLKVRSGEQLILNQVLYAYGVSFVELYDGAPLTNMHGIARLEVNAEQGQRVGVRPITPGTRITSASGRVYPVHAMSAEAVVGSLASLRIKGSVYYPLTGQVGLVVDAVPGASYVLEKSTDLVTWEDVTSIQTAPDFQELVLTATWAGESRAFWRVRGMPR